MGHDPGLQNSPELDVTLGRGEQLVVLMTAWDVHFNLKEGGKKKHFTLEKPFMTF